MYQKRGPKKLLEFAPHWNKRKHHWPHETGQRRIQKRMTVHQIRGPQRLQQRLYLSNTKTNIGCTKLAIKYTSKRSKIETVQQKWWTEQVEQGKEKTNTATADGILRMQCNNTHSIIYSMCTCNVLYIYLKLLFLGFLLTKFTCIFNKLILIYSFLLEPLKKCGGGI